jgi:hypothetical protein
MTPIQINKINEENLFNILLNCFEITGIDNLALANEVLSNQKRLSDNKNTSLYEDTVFNVDSGEQSSRLLKAIQTLTHQSNLNIKEVWSQIHYPKESTGLHNHGHFQMAFVYYVSVPSGSGDLVFSLENGLLLKEVTPVEGRLLVFPGWVNHKVSKNTGDKIRISISGNLA